MKRLALLSVLALVIGAAGLGLVKHDPGYVLISVAGKTIEMRFWFAVFCVLLIWFVLWLIRHWLARLLSLVTGGWQFASSSRARKAESRTHRGLIDFIEGNWDGAKRHLLKAARDVDQPLVHYLAAARSSYELGEGDKARELIAKAEKVAPGNELAVTLSQARMQLLDKKYEQCLATLHRAKTVAPHHPVVLDLLYRVYLALQDWRSLERILPDLAKARVPRHEDERQALQKQVYIELLKNAGKKAASAQGSDDSPEKTELHDVWHRVPKNLKQTPEFVATYCRILMALQRPHDAEPLLRQTVKHEWSDPLVELYGLLSSVDPQKQLQTAERWLKDHPDDACLLLALGRICLRNELWGKAREYFQQSLQLQPMPTTYAELARLLAYLGEHKLSTDYYQRGLLLTTNDLPNLPMPASVS